MVEQCVSLVIPGRNCARTIAACLDAAEAIRARPGSPLGEILIIDDGSTDQTAELVAARAVQYEKTGACGGPGAARNVGWKKARFSHVWFIDADCVPRIDALERLLPHLSLPAVGAVGGSYGNLHQDRLLARLVHEEIVERHRGMRMDVSFLGGFNMLVKRAALVELGGFDEHNFNGPGSPGAEDADLAYRLLDAGYRLRFEPESIVAHFHPTSLPRYLRSQCVHGFWRVYLHMHHRDTAGGDSYSGLTDHVQPFLAIGTLLACIALIRRVAWPPVAFAGLLAVAQLPMTLRLVARKGVSYLLFAPLGFVRAFWRAVGMVHGMVAYALRPDRAARGPVSAAPGAKAAQDR